ncbi:MAG: glycosyltransferase family 2 protein [Pseudomonadota bacterium]
MRAAVSVVIPCYRCTATIARAVQSVADQTLPPQELLLVEDCSDDAGQTLEMLYHVQRDYGHTLDIRILALGENRGPGGARNAGWDAAGGNYLAFLDADDEWHPQKLSVQYGYMQQHPDIAVTGHQYFVMRDSEPRQPAEKLPHTRISPASLLFRNSFPTSSVMLKREIGLRFAPGKRFAEDLYLWQQIAYAGFLIVRIEAPLVYYYKALYGADGLSARLWDMERGELENLSTLYRDRTIGRTLSIAASLFSLVKYCKRVVFTRLLRQ